MKTPHILFLACATVLLAGCTTAHRSGSSVMPVTAYAAEEPIATSLFPSDQAVLSDEAVARILSSKLELPSQARVALMKFPDTAGARYYGRYYWRDEAYLKLQQSQIDTVSAALQASDQVAVATPLPSLMTPSKASIPRLREAAVRMQADLLLVFRVGSDMYSQNRTFKKDRVKAYSTCELVLLDVRTGLVPFTRVVSRERSELKQPTDFDLSETLRRAQTASADEALKAGTADLVAFLESVTGKRD